MLSKIDVPTDSVNVEASHWLYQKQKVILKLCTRKNSGKIRWSSKKLKEDDLESIENNSPVYKNDSPVYKNDSLCVY